MDKKPIKETGVIHDFFKEATFQKSLNDKKAGIYQELVFFRFKESLESIYPLTFKFLPENTDENQVTLLIREFISKGALSWSLRDMAREFQDFLTEKLGDFKWLKDLMWFEYSEVTVMPGKIGTEGRNFYLDDTRDFYKDRFCLSESCSSGKVSHEVFNASIREIDETGIVVYRKPGEGALRYKTISVFTFHVLENLQKNLDLENSLDRVFNLFDFSKDDRNIAEDIFAEVFADLLESGIIDIQTP